MLPVLTVLSLVLVAWLLHTVQQEQARQDQITHALQAQQVATCHTGNTIRGSILDFIHKEIYAATPKHPSRKMLAAQAAYLADANTTFRSRDCTILPGAP